MSVNFEETAQQLLVEIINHFGFIVAGSSSKFGVGDRVPDFDIVWPDGKSRLRHPIVVIGNSSFEEYSQQYDFCCRLVGYRGVLDHYDYYYRVSTD